MRNQQALRCLAGTFCRGLAAFDLECRTLAGAVVARVGQVVQGAHHAVLALLRGGHADFGSFLRRAGHGLHRFGSEFVNAALATHGLGCKLAHGGVALAVLVGNGHDFVHALALALGTGLCAALLALGLGPGGGGFDGRLAGIGRVVFADLGVFVRHGAVPRGCGDVRWRAVIAVITSDADAHVGRYADQRNFERLPIGDAVGFRVVLAGLEHGRVDAVPDADVAANAVHDILEHLLGSRAFSETHHGAANLVRTDLHRLDHADLIAGAVIHEQGATLFHAIQAHAFLAVVQDFIPPVAVHRSLAGKRDLDGARIRINGGTLAVQHEVALGAAAGFDFIGNAHLSLTVR